MKRGILRDRRRVAFISEGQPIPDQDSPRYRGRNDGPGAPSGDILCTPDVVAALLGVTTARLRQLSKEGLLRPARGQYPLRACIQWYVAYWRERALARAGNDTKEKKQLLEVQLLKVRLAERLRPLIQRSEVATVMGLANLRLSNALEQLSEQLCDEGEWPPDILKSARERIEDFRNAFVEDVAEFL